MGRPTKFDPELGKQIVLAIQAGAYIETAAAAAGISKNTLYDWLRKGARPSATPALKEFSDAVKKAMAMSELRDLAVIDKAAQGGQVLRVVTTTKQGKDGQLVTKEEKHLTSPQWQASAWRLERKHPEKWGTQRAYEARLQEELTVIYEALKQELSPEDFARVLARIPRLAAGDDPTRGGDAQG